MSNLSHRDFLTEKACREHPVFPKCHRIPAGGYYEGRKIYITPGLQRYVVCREGGYEYIRLVP